MSKIIIESKAAGDWGYEVLEGKRKERQFIKSGFNTIDKSHLEVLEEDNGFKALCKKGTFKILSSVEAKKEEKKKEKEDAAIQELEQYKAKVKEEIDKLKEDHKADFKDLKDRYNKELQNLTELKGEALNKMKELEKKVSDLETENAKLKKDLPVVKKLEEKIKSLEDENAKLKKEVAK